MPLAISLNPDLDDLRALLARTGDLDALALRAGAIYTPQGEGRGDFRLLYWSREVILHLPELTGAYTDDDSPLAPLDAALVARYLLTTDGSPMADRWVTFEQLPESARQAPDFQQRTGDALARAFGNDAEAFISANERLFGRREFFGPLAFSYQVLPRVAVMVVGWLGGEETPAAYRILFDAGAPRHLPVDACAALGRRLTQKLVESAGA